MPSKRKPLLVLVAIAALIAAFGPDTIPNAAGQGFNPFGEPETSRPQPRRTPPQAEAGEPSGVERTPLPYGPIDERGRSVERTDLAPVMADDGSGLPYELWQGLSIAEFESLLARVDIPPRSPVLHGLWRRLITSSVPPSRSDTTESKFAALRMEALDRSGLIKEAADLIARDPSAASDPVLSSLAARMEIGLGNRDRGCELAQAGVTAPTQIPQSLKADLILIAGYCAAVKGDMTAAGIKAGLAREQAHEGSAGPDALEAIAAGATPPLAKGTKLTVLDYRILELGGATPAADVLANSSPALLAALALDPRTEPSLRQSAGEAAARVNAIAPDQLAAIYRSQLSAGGQANDEDGRSRRADLYRAAELEQTPSRKARFIRSFLDESKHAGLYWIALQLMAQPADTLQPVAEIGWFAETGIEIGLASGSLERARSWVSTADAVDRPGGGGLRHWLALADVADPGLATGRSTNLASVEALAASGRLDPRLLHRLATVLDALEIQVPIPLWDLASRTPQPSDGHLPETGVLSQLQEAAKKREYARTVLLAMDALGPTSADGAHLLALSDAIRALRRAGLEADARRLGLEALFFAWPRSTGT